MLFFKPQKKKNLHLFLLRAAIEHTVKRPAVKKQNKKTKTKNNHQKPPRCRRDTHRSSVSCQALSTLLKIRPWDVGIAHTG